VNDYTGPDGSEHGVVKVIVRIHVDDYHDTRHDEVPAGGLAIFKADLAKAWDIPVERVSERTSGWLKGQRIVTLTIDE
jgi:hypothetical protein